MQGRPHALAVPATQAVRMLLARELRDVEHRPAIAEALENASGTASSAAPAHIPGLAARHTVAAKRSAAAKQAARSPAGKLE